MSISRRFSTQLGGARRLLHTAQEHSVLSLPTTMNASPSPLHGKDRAAPFVKWAGGKRRLIPEIMARLSASFSTYHEPFLGGGAVFFALAGERRITRAVLSDTNAELIGAYRAVRESPKALIRLLEAHKEAHGEEGYYYRVRDRHGATAGGAEARLASAARFIYLNKTCYNGLYRVNSKGRFNVPQGRYQNPTIYHRENLLAVSRVLQNAELAVRDFSEIEPEAGDVIYCDPPYDDTFNSYAAGGFGEAGQRRLREWMDRWREKGCYVLLSNSDTPLIRDLYADYRIAEIAAPRYINSKGSGRGMTKELLVMGFAEGGSA
uniref:Site-specific DNA-methyltransferase (adenine-specific) n=1 Tax=Candidatus Kentrum sp. DK TaxID=2126562 RepID=A0A450S7F1_9GAMM|nr:MAG: DNA adenine methylase [Candidatus Kentron sp. DK]